MCRYGGAIRSGQRQFFQFFSAFWLNRHHTSTHIEYKRIEYLQTTYVFVTAVSRTNLKWKICLEQYSVIVLGQQKCVSTANEICPQ